MAQPIHFSIHISPMHLIGAVVVSQVLFREKIMELVGKRLNDIIDTVYATGKNLALDFPVIALATGLTYAVHQLTRYAPSLALSPAGSMKAATFVGGVFALKAALTPLLEIATKHEREITHGELIRNTVVLNYLPVALGTLYAYYDSIPVKLAQSALFTAALIPVIKFLGKGYESFCGMEGVKERIQGWYSYFGLERS